MKKWWRCMLLLIGAFCGLMMVPVHAQEIEENTVAKQEGFLNLQRISTDSSISDGNPNYSLEGAEYGVYLEQTCETEVGRLITLEDGSSNTLTVTAGTYYVKEQSASEGYDPNDDVGVVVIVEELTTTITMASEPVSIPVENLLQRIDTETKAEVPQDNASFGGAQFRVQFFAENSMDEESIEKLSAKRTWILETDEKGALKLHPDYLLEGDAIWQNQEGQYVLPLGIVSIQEIQESKGYELNAELYLVILEKDMEVFCELKIPAQKAVNENENLETYNNGSETAAGNEPETEAKEEENNQARLPETGGIGRVLIVQIGSVACVLTEIIEKKEEE